MLFNRTFSTQFKNGDKVVSLVIHPPEIKSGTNAKIISPYNATLYAVKLPDGELHRWFAEFELEPVNKKQKSLKFGDLAKVTNSKGHPSMIKEGMIVKIAKVIKNATFYDLKLEDGKYHRWLAEFEITYPI